MVGFVREMEIETEMREQRAALLKAAEEERPISVHWSVWQRAYQTGEIGYSYSGQFAQTVPVKLPLPRC